MIIGFIANVGDGKTCSMVELSTNLQKEGYGPIYSNMTERKPPFIPLTIDILLGILNKTYKLEPTAILEIDEIMTLMSARGSATNKLNLQLARLFLQHRKLGQGHRTGIFILWTTQYPNLVDIILWELTTIKVIPKMELNTPQGDICKQKWVIETIGKTIIKKRSFIANPIYELYNDKEIISPKN